MKRFIKDLKKYKYYIKFATKSKIKNEVIDSYLGWIWIFLDPLLFMLIYAFISVVVFGKTQQYLAAFICIGLTIWKFFKKCARCLYGIRRHFFRKNNKKPFSSYYNII